MVKKFTLGNPINTEAVIKQFDSLSVDKFPFEHKIENGKFSFEFNMNENDIVYGLGEAPRGINKRGWVYESFCADDPFHT
ncbi:MAG TPA: hypothetical protein DEP65_00635 [Ruminococcus sp.]|nr:hypothetical protein [Ruminococcus sp.]